MTYVDALKVDDTIHVVERRGGKRIFQKCPAKYVFYSKHPKGQYKSIYGDNLIKFETSSFRHFQKEQKSIREGALFEHDINVVIRFLEDNYKGAIAPDLHVAFFDIEVDFDPTKGFSSPDDPYCPVNAVSVYQSWTGKNLSLVLKPKTLDWDQAATICDKFENTTLCTSEEEFFEKFFELIEDADVVSGWNSTTFDIPYIIRRLEKIKNREATKKFCLWNQYPTKRTFEKFGKEQITYDLHGIVHLDYLDLYQKHTYHEMHSYRLDFVAEYEIGDKKVPYEGSLDKLYNHDFEKFIEYNRQDTMLLVHIDNKLKFIDLSNQLAHENTVLLQTTLGSVALIEQAIINEIHEQNLIGPSRKRAKGDESSVAGAFVANPKKGMHDWVGSVDINSLYPSVIRALNMSPETIMGQFKLNATREVLRDRIKNQKMSSSDAWHDFFGVKEYQLIQDRAGDNLVCQLEDGTEITNSARSWYQTIYNQGSGICLSANGTMFRTDHQGIIPGLLERWYNERVEIRKEAKEMFGKLSKLKEENGDPELIKELEVEIAFRDKRQLIKKILLNSLYGALLNPHCRFFDQRLGQSVTLTGRCITKHMCSKMNEIFTGEYDYKGICSIYSDTDSVVGDTIIETNYGEMTIKDLFNSCSIRGSSWAIDDQEFTSYDQIQILSYDPETEKETYKPFECVYRHKVSKPKYKITDEDGNEVIMTDDHSVMVERDGELLEIKPSEINVEIDFLISHR